MNPTETDERRLSDVERQQLNALLHEQGERPLAAMLRVSRQTLYRALAGAPMQRTTVLALRQLIARALHTHTAT